MVDPIRKKVLHEPFESSSAKKSQSELRMPQPSDLPKELIHSKNYDALTSHLKAKVLSGEHTQTYSALQKLLGKDHPKEKASIIKTLIKNLAAETHDGKP